MIQINLADWRAAADIVDALVTAAEIERARGDAALARRYTGLADAIGDGIEGLPQG